MSVEAIEAANALTAGMKDLTTEFGEFRTDAQAKIERNRRVNRWLALSLAFDITLSVVLGFVALKARTTSQHVARNSTTEARSHHRALSNCEAVNATRDGLSSVIAVYVASLPPALGVEFTAKTRPFVVHIDCLALANAR